MSVLPLTLNSSPRQLVQAGNSGQSKPVEPKKTSAKGEGTDQRPQSLGINYGGSESEDSVVVDLSPASTAGVDSSGSPNSPVSVDSVPAAAVQSAKGASAPSTPDDFSGRLTEEEKRMVAELQARDREVRAHEEAHRSQLGPHAKGGIRYSYQQGPDGRQYAIGGSIGVDLSPEQDAEKTIAKMRRIKQAANAPAEPSGPDRQVAGQAASLESQARMELSKQRTEEQAAQEESGQIKSLSGDLRSSSELSSLQDSVNTSDNDGDKTRVKVLAAYERSLREGFLPALVDDVA